MKRPSLFALVFILCSLSGCSSFGDFVIPAHPSSASKAPDIVCVRPQVSRYETLDGTASAFLIRELFELGADGVERLLEFEKARYTATYSGSATTPIHISRITEDDALAGIRTIEGFELYRVAARTFESDPPSCTDLAGGDPHLFASFKITEDRFIPPEAVSDEESTERVRYGIEPQRIALRHAKAKVPVYSVWRPWTWAEIEHEHSTLDMNYRITLTTPVMNARGDWQDHVIAKVDFPVADLKLPDEVRKTSTLGQDALRGLGVRWFSFPALSQLETRRSSEGGTLEHGRLQISVQITEQNEFGKRVQDRIQELRENRDDWSGAVSDTVRDE